MDFEEYQESGIYSAAAFHCTVTLALLVLSGCAGPPPTRIDSEDTNLFQKTVRASFNINGGGRAASEPRSGHAIEIGQQSAAVSSNQSLAATQQPVMYNGTTFMSPNQLSNVFNFSYTDVSWRMRNFILGGQFGAELLAGLGQTSLGLSVATPAQSTYQQFNTTGVQGGLGVIWRLSPKSSLHARWSGYFTFDSGVNNISKYEFYYANAIYKYLSLRAGYSDWTVKGYGDSGASDFQMRFAGPLLALDCNFNLGD